MRVDTDRECPTVWICKDGDRNQVVRELCFDVGDTIGYLSCVADLVSDGYEIFDQGYGFTCFESKE